MHAAPRAESFACAPCGALGSHGRGAAGPHRPVMTTSHPCVELQLAALNRPTCMLPRCLTCPMLKKTVRDGDAAALCVIVLPRRLVAVSRVPKTGQAFQDALLTLPSEALSMLCVELELITTPPAQHTQQAQRPAQEAPGVGGGGGRAGSE